MNRNSISCEIKVQMNLIRIIKVINIITFLQSNKQLSMDQELIQQQKDVFNQQYTPGLTTRVSQFEQLNLRYSYSGISNASSSNDFLLTTMRSFSEDLIKLNFIQASQLYETINRLAVELQKRMLIHHDLIVYLLYLFKWNQEKLNEVYYDKLSTEFLVMNQRINKKYGDVNGNDDMMKEEPLFGLCEICCCEDVQMYTSCLCAHHYCKQCWTAYIKQNLTHNTIFFPCMHTECHKYPILLQFVNQVAPQLIELYKKKICVNYSIVNKSISYCPSDQCQFFCQKPSNIQQNYIQCPCGIVYCFKCEKEPHQPACCIEVENWEKLTNEEKNNQMWIEKYTRKCPTCKQSVEKYIGCNQVKCVCGTQFCFNCKSIWDEKHKSSSDCTIAKIKNPLSQSQQSSHQPLFQKILYISRCINNDMSTIKNTLSLIAKEQPLHYLKQMFQQIKSRVHQAWTNIKWTLIALFLRGKPQIDSEIEKDSIQSIKSLMETVQKVQKKIDSYHAISMSHLIYLDSKELLYFRQELFKRKEIMIKTIEVWTEAWRNNSGEY